MVVCCCRTVEVDGRLAGATEDYLRLRHRAKEAHAVSAEEQAQCAEARRKVIRLQRKQPPIVFFSSILISMELQREFILYSELWWGSRGKNNRKYMVMTASANEAAPAINRVGCAPELRRKELRTI